MDHWISEMITKKQRRLETCCTENMQQLQTNLKDMMRILIELIQKLNGNIFLQQPQGVLLHHSDVDHPTAGGQHGVWTLHHGMGRRFFVPDVRFSPTSKSDSRVSDGECSQNNLPHTFFSCAQLVRL